MRQGGNMMITGPPGLAPPPPDGGPAIGGLVDFSFSNLAASSMTFALGGRYKRSALGLKSILSESIVAFSHARALVENLHRAAASIEVV